MNCAYFHASFFFYFLKKYIRKKNTFIKFRHILVYICNNISLVFRFMKRWPGRIKRARAVTLWFSCLISTTTTTKKRSSSSKKKTRIGDITAFAQYYIKKKYFHFIYYIKCARCCVEACAFARIYLLYVCAWRSSRARTLLNIIISFIYVYIRCVYTICVVVLIYRYSKIHSSGLYILHQSIYMYNFEKKIFEIFFYLHAQLLNLLL